MAIKSHKEFLEILYSLGIEKDQFIVDKSNSIYKNSYLYLAINNTIKIVNLGTAHYKDMDMDLISIKIINLLKEFGLKQEEPEEEHIDYWGEIL